MFALAHYIWFPAGCVSVISFLLEQGWGMTCCILRWNSNCCLLLIKVCNISTQAIVAPEAENPKAVLPWSKNRTKLSKITNNFLPFPDIQIQLPEAAVSLCLMLGPAQIDQQLFNVNVTAGRFSSNLPLFPPQNAVCLAVGYNY